MINKKTVEQLAKTALEQHDLFLVKISISPANAIKVVIDGDRGVTIDQCMAVSRAIEHNLDRDTEDFALEVTSYGLSNPLLLTRQYVKNIGKNLKVMLTDGSKIKGKLTDANDDIIRIEKELTKKEIKEGIDNQLIISRETIKEAKVEISFK